MGLLVSVERFDKTKLVITYFYKQSREEKKLSSLSNFVCHPKAFLTNLGFSSHWLHDNTFWIKDFVTELGPSLPWAVIWTSWFFNVNFFDDPDFQLICF